MLKNTGLLSFLGGKTSLTMLGVSGVLIGLALVTKKYSQKSK